MANEKPTSAAPCTPAPDAVRCQAGSTEAQPNGSCGAGQPLYTTNGLVHCWHHSDWPNSKEARKFLAVLEIDKA
jgi:hypothetical protein